MRSWWMITAPRVPVSLVVVVVGLVLVACCALWAVAVQTLVPDVCSGEADILPTVGPYTCPGPTPAALPGSATPGR